MVLDNQVSYRTVDPDQRSQISHLVVLTLPGDRGSGRVTYEIAPLFNIENVEAVETDGESMAASTVRYRMTVATATVSQRLLLEAQAQQALHDYEGAIATYTRAINLNPDIADFYARRGSVYLAQAAASSDTVHSHKALVADWETAAQLYEQVGHRQRANALRNRLKFAISPGI